MKSVEVDYSEWDRARKENIKQLDHFAFFHFVVCPKCKTDITAALYRIGLLGAYSPAVVCGCGCWLYLQLSDYPLWQYPDQQSFAYAGFYRVIDARLGVGGPRLTKNRNLNYW